MILTEIAPKRWVVRNEKGGKILGTIEHHEFYSYNEHGERFLTGFWMSRLPENGWKETGWKKALTQEDALGALLTAKGFKR